MKYSRQDARIGRIFEAQNQRNRMRLRFRTQVSFSTVIEIHKLRVRPAHCKLFNAPGKLRVVVYINI